MRRILILLAIGAVGGAALAALWMFRGREIASFIDRYWTVETQSAPIQSIRYEGSGTGGILIANDVSLSLNDVRPGFVAQCWLNEGQPTCSGRQRQGFPFRVTQIRIRGYWRASRYCADSGRAGFLATRHSVLSWPTPLDLNFMTG